MDSVAGARQRLLAVFLPGTAALFLVGQALTRKGLDQPIMTMATALKMLPIAAKHPNQLYVSNVLVIVGLGTLGVSFMAIATLVRDGGSAIATVAAVIAGVASFFGAIVNVLVGFNLAAATQAHKPPEVAARFLVTTFKSGVATVFLIGYFFGLLLATLLMGIALWRSRSVPRWLAVIFAIGWLAVLIAPAGIVYVSLMLPFAVAIVILASRIWQMASLPASHNFEPTGVPG
jgi:hypothetical protein